MPKINSYLLQKIKEELLKKRMTFNSLCNEIGMTENGLKYSLNNKTVKLSTLEKISQVLEIDLMDLFGIIGFKIYNPKLFDEYRELENKIKQMEEQLEDKKEIIRFLKEEVENLKKQIK